jgi:nucleoside-diphosphate-sugar epimerase
VHVSDIVAANLAALDAEVDQCVCNVGAGRAVSVREIADLLIAKIAPDLRPQHAPAQPGELQNCIADVSHAARVLGYKPRGVLEARISEVIEYVKNRG